MITLPPEITFEKRALPEGGWSYDFRHRALGALGRILLQGLPGGRDTHVSCEVAGDPADPRTAERRAIFTGMQSLRSLFAPAMRIAKTWEPQMNTDERR